MDVTYICTLDGTKQFISYMNNKGNINMIKITFMYEVPHLFIFLST